MTTDATRLRNEPEYDPAAEFATEARRNAELTAFIEDIVTIADSAKESDFLRRAMHSVYNMGRTHEAIDAMARINAIGRQMVGQS